MSNYETVGSNWKIDTDIEPGRIIVVKYYRHRSIVAGLRSRSSSKVAETICATPQHD